MLDFHGNYREKSALISLIVTVVTFGAYFAFALFFASSDSKIFLVLFVVLIFFIIMRLILFIGLLLGHGDEKADERDLLVAGKAFRNAYYVLATIVIVMATFVTYSAFQAYGGTGLGYPNRTSAGFPVFRIFINSLLFTTVVGELTLLGSKVYYYKKGA